MNIQLTEQEFKEVDNLIANRIRQLYQRTQKSRNSRYLDEKERLMKLRVALYIQRDLGVKDES